MATFIIQIKEDKPNSTWSDCEIVSGITGREACYLADERQKWYNSLLTTGETPCIIRAKPLTKVGRK